MVSPGETHICPKSAACWSPAMPARATSAEAEGGADVAVDLAGASDLGQQAARDAEEAQQLVVPLAGVDVEQQRPGGVARVGEVEASAGEVPDEPGVHGAEGQLARLRARPRPRHVVEDPRHLGAREVGIEHQAGPLTHHGLRAFRPEPVADIGGAPVLPDDRVHDGLPRLAVPHDGGLALVRDADGRHVARAQRGRGQHIDRHADLRRPDLLRVVLHPAGLGEDLPELALRGPLDPAVVIEQDGAGAGGPLVQREDVGHLEPHPGFYRNLRDRSKPEEERR